MSARRCFRDISFVSRLRETPAVTLLDTDKYASFNELQKKTPATELRSTSLKLEMSARPQRIDFSGSYPKSTYTSSFIKPATLKPISNLLVDGFLKN